MAPACALAPRAGHSPWGSRRVSATTRQVLIPTPTHNRAPASTSIQNTSQVQDSGPQNPTRSDPPAFSLTTFLCAPCLAWSSRATLNPLMVMNIYQCLCFRFLLLGTPRSEILTLQTISILCLHPPRLQFPHIEEGLPVPLYKVALPSPHPPTPSFLTTLTGLCTDNVPLT